jgi:sterol desaturase/sphingolipid hydroxylase (fatty acid hydroxylase superfamily)
MEKLNLRNFIFILGAFTLVTALTAWIGTAFDSKESFIWFFENVIRPPARAVKNVFSNPLTYIALAAILAIERFMPAKRNQKILSVGFAQDTIWFGFDIVAQATVIAALATYWQAVYREYFSFLTIRAIEEFPFWLRFTIAVLVADFAGWLHHYMRHKIWWMWPFHAIHHSQKELNLFTAVRYHVLEYMLTAVIYVFFFGMFTMNPHAVIYYSLFYGWYTKMTHANIRSNFGILRYVLVTPQSHRIHHSFLPEHRDKNLGIIFSVWDFMFGTQYRKYDEYPDSGIEDQTFPHEEEHNWGHLMWTFVKQHFYPFVAIANELKKKKAPSLGVELTYARFRVEIPHVVTDSILKEEIEAREIAEQIMRINNRQRLFPHETDLGTSSTRYIGINGAGAPKKEEIGTN